MDPYKNDYYFAYDIIKCSQMNEMLPVVTPYRMSLDVNALPKTI